MKLLGVIILSLLAGFIWSTWDIESKVNLEPNIVPEESTGLKPCSSVNTMPCEVSPRDELKEQLDTVKAPVTLFKRGQEITCIYPGVFWWTDKNEFMKTVAMICKVVEASEEYKEFGAGYQHLKVDCSKDLNFKSSNQPGLGMVRNHKLNYKVRWFSSDSCYHFVQR